MVTIKSNLFNVWKLKELRDGKSLSYKTVAGESGVAPATLHKYRSGTVKSFEVDTLQKLCAFFDCSVCDIILTERNGQPGTPAA